MKSLKMFGQLACALFLILNTLHGKEEVDINRVVLQAVASMPTGGGYATTPVAMKHLDQAVSMCDGALVIQPRVATPSFCSEATYLVFLKTIAMLQAQKKIVLSPQVLTALLPHPQADGEGFWGCWNANGPGVARLFYTCDLGFNFSDLSAARPGDFLKIFWTEAIGAAEHGHLVVYLGTEKKGNITYLHYWSSNKPDGYGQHVCPLSKTHHLIFSRFLRPESLEHSLSRAQKDTYLASLLSSRSTSWEEVKRLCGVRTQIN
jgi:hypothetical protein